MSVGCRCSKIPLKLNAATFFVRSFGFHVVFHLLETSKSVEEGNEGRVEEGNVPCNMTTWWFTKKISFTYSTICQMNITEHREFKVSLWLYYHHITHQIQRLLISRNASNQVALPVLKSRTPSRFSSWLSLTDLRFGSKVPKLEKWTFPFYNEDKKQVCNSSGGVTLFA